MVYFVISEIDRFLQKVVYFSFSVFGWRWLANGLVFLWRKQTTHTIPLPEQLLHLYTDYLVDELGALESESLPNYVFVNLWEGEIGRPMSYAAVMSLVKRLAKKTAITFTPHMFRHTRATSWIKEDKLALPVVSRLLTHTSIQTTNDLYLHLTCEDLRAALARRKGADA